MNTVKFYKDISYLENLKKTLKNEIQKIQKIDNEIIKKNIIKKLYSLYKHIDAQLKPLLNYESINLELIPTPPDSEENILNLEEVLNSELSEDQYDSLEELIPKHLNIPNTFKIFALINDMPQYDHINSYMYYYRDSKPIKNKISRHHNTSRQHNIMGLNTFKQHNTSKQHNTMGLNTKFKIKPSNTNLGNNTTVIKNSQINEKKHINSNSHNMIDDDDFFDDDTYNFDNIKLNPLNHPNQPNQLQIPQSTQLQIPQSTQLPNQLQIPQSTQLQIPQPKQIPQPTQLQIPKPTQIPQTLEGKQQQNSNDYTVDINKIDFMRNF